MTTKYSVNPSVAYARAILENLPAKTGRSIDEWAELVAAQGPAGTVERRAWLKSEHGVGGTTVGMIVDRSEGRGRENTDPEAYLAKAGEWVEAMYAGPKAALLPIHDRILELGSALGDDVRVCPRKTIVPLYRHHVFAQIKASTRTRVDLGLALAGADEALPERLLPTGGLEKGDRITHRFALSVVDEVDGEVAAWLRRAYEVDR